MSPAFKNLSEGEQRRILYTDFFLHKKHKLVTPETEEEKKTREDLEKNLQALKKEQNNKNKANNNALNRVRKKFSEGNIREKQNQLFRKTSFNLQDYLKSPNSKDYLKTTYGQEAGVFLEDKLERETRGLKGKKREKAKAIILENFLKKQRPATQKLKDPENMEILKSKSEDINSILESKELSNIEKDKAIRNLFYSTKLDPSVMPNLTFILSHNKSLYM